MQQMNLFNTNSHVSGFRLDYMEIYNWGTFDKEIYRISPNGNNSLLTGANASGKSTLIDALLTLLVPLKRNRFYNQSSGVEKKGNRTEESYFYGQYGSQQIEGSTGTRTLRLRDKNSRSILLVNFKGVDTKVLTLFQVRYISGEELKVVYGIGKTSLEIARDFAKLDNRGLWKRSLEITYNTNTTKKIIEFCSGPREYGEKICDLFGMKSDKALTLFNQIVGVKVLDDLDVFIRNNMLKDEPAEEKYVELRENFQNLTEAKKCIDKVNEQIEQLGPIDELANKISNSSKRLENLRSEKEIAAYYFAKKTVELCDSKIEEIQNICSRLNCELKKFESEKAKYDEAKIQLNVAIQQDEVGIQIREISIEIENLNEKYKERLDKSVSYNNLATELDLISDPDRDDFNDNIIKVKSIQEQVNKYLKETMAAIEKCKQESCNIEKDIYEDIQNIKQLREHQNNIIGRVSEIRDEILNYVHATREEIPFIGELIRVKDEEQEWEPSIEKILHNFALRLIVPDEYYSKVNEYVNSHNMKGRIVYHHYEEYYSLKQFMSNSYKGNTLYEKLDFRSSNRYVEWVEDIIRKDYNYTCVDDLEEFEQYKERAVTREGLIKSVNGKHEKDDREGVSQKCNYVLGWDNKNKIAELQVLVRKNQDKQQQINGKINKYQCESEKKKCLDKKCSEIIYAYSTFDDIDWKSITLEIQERKDTKQKLENTNNKVQELQHQLDKINEYLAENEKKSNETRNKLSKNNFQKEVLEKKRKDNFSLISIRNSVDCSSFEDKYELYSVIYDNIDTVREHIQNKISSDYGKEQINNSELCSRVKERITKFKHPNPDILNKYPSWVSDVNSLPGSENSDLIGEYQKYYKRLVEEDLISIKEKFNNYLQETLTQRINAFRMFFNTWENNINESLSSLNEPLKSIDFDSHPSTYIQLVATRKTDADIKEFRRMLDDAVPNIREVDSIIDGRKNHFNNKLEPFIKKLEDEQWRKKVMDVRTWFSYKAEEFFKETDQKRKTYQSMGQLSGGEKAQLTYTILGSAIAYQFGLTKSGCDSSFRFIAIDEAFKAQDEIKARYLMSLCKQLHLQLLVVTPCDNIHIVENDISYVHYIERVGNKSVLINMPILEFKEARDKYEQ